MLTMRHGHAACRTGITHALVVVVIFSLRHCLETIMRLMNLELQVAKVARTARWKSPAQV